MAIAGLVLFFCALALFAAGLLGVMPPGLLLGTYMMIAALLALAMAASEGRLSLRHRRVR